MRVLTAILLLSGAISVCPASVDDSADSPKEVALALARKAARARKSGEDAQAYIFYSEAAALQPKNRKFKSLMDSLQTSAARQSKPRLPATPAGADGHVILDPSQIFDSATAREIA